MVLITNFQIVSRFSLLIKAYYRNTHPKGRYPATKDLDLDNSTAIRGCNFY